MFTPHNRFTRIYIETIAMLKHHMGCKSALPVAFLFQFICDYQKRQIDNPQFCPHNPELVLGGKRRLAFALGGTISSSSITTYLDWLVEVELLQLVVGHNNESMYAPNDDAYKFYMDQFRESDEYEKHCRAWLDFDDTMKHYAHLDSDSR
jgi:hypothetical protein